MEKFLFLIREDLRVISKSREGDNKLMQEMSLQGGPGIRSKKLSKLTQIMSVHKTG
jgi:hypothetical protein